MKMKNQANTEFRQRCGGYQSTRWQDLVTRATELSEQSQTDSGRQ